MIIADEKFDRNSKYQNEKSGEKETKRTNIELMRKQKTGFISESRPIFKSRLSLLCLKTTR